MLRIFAMVVAGLIAMGPAFGGGLASAAPMRAPSTGAVSGDWDIDVEGSGAVPVPGGSLGDQYFHVTWTATRDGHGQSRITGRVYDDTGRPATGVELWIGMLDASGHETQGVTRPVAGTVPAEGDAYFDVRVSESTAYHVSVSSFNLVEFGPG